MHKVKFDFTISVGNILTIVAGILVAITAITSIEIANAERDQKIASLDTRIIKNEKVQNDIIIVKQDVIRIQVNQRNQEKMLERIINHLEN